MYDDTMSHQELRRREEEEARAWAIEQYLENCSDLLEQHFLLTSEEKYLAGRYMYITLREVKTDWIFRNVRIDRENLCVGWPQPDWKEEEEKEGEFPRCLFKANNL